MLLNRCKVLQKSSIFIKIHSNNSIFDRWAVQKNQDRLILLAKALNCSKTSIAKWWYHLVATIFFLRFQKNTVESVQLYSLHVSCWMTRATLKNKSKTSLIISLLCRGFTLFHIIFNNKFYLKWILKEMSISLDILTESSLILMNHFRELEILLGCLWEEADTTLF